MNAIEAALHNAYERERAMLDFIESGRVATAVSIEDGESLRRLVGHMLRQLCIETKADIDRLSAE